MPDETPEVTGEEEVTDAMLDEAAGGEPVTEEVASGEEAVKEEAEASPSTEKVEEHEEEGVDEPQDHSSRSKLGRKVAQQADEIKILKDMNQSILSMLEKMTGKKDEPRGAESEPDDLPDPDTTVITTGRDLLNFLGKFQKVAQSKQSEAAQKYQVGYLGTVEKMAEASGLDETTVKEVTDLASNQEAKNPHNKRKTGNPMVDAQLNFNSALAAVMRMRLESRARGATDEVNPLKGGKPKAHLGPSIKSRSSQGDLAIPDLDADAKELVEYAKKTGIPITEEDLMDLRKPMPFYLGGGRA
jgi:hypothetical protein